MRREVEAMGPGRTKPRDVTVGKLKSLKPSSPMSGPDLFSNEEKKPRILQLSFLSGYGDHFHNNEAKENVGFSCR